MQPEFELKFEGPKDDSPTTLRQIKGVFVADLEFPASDVQRFIEGAPIVIKKAESEEQLQRDFNLLSKAGAKVIIEQIIKQDMHNLDSLELEFEQVLHSRPTELVPAFEEDNRPIELDLSFDDSELDLVAPEPEVAKEESTDLKMFDSLELSFDQETEIQKPEAIENSAAPEAATPSKPTVDSRGLDLNSSSGDLELELFQPGGESIFGEIINSAKEESIQTETSLGNPEPILTEVQTELQEDPKPALSAIEPIKAPIKAEDISTDSEVSTETVIELTLAELKALQTPKKKRSLNIKHIAVVLLAVCSMVYVNIKILNSDTDMSNPFDSLLQSLPTIVEEVDPEKQKLLLQQKAEEIAASSWHKAEGIFPNRSYKISVWVENSVPLHASFEMTTPKPSPLTKEEIVNGVSARPWLKRLEIKDLMLSKNDTGWSAEGTALAYLANGERNLRLTTKAKMIAILNTDSGNFEINLTAGDKQTEQSELSTNILSFGTSIQSASDLNNFSFNEKIQLKKP
jgi:hypothetical protein